MDLKNSNILVIVESPNKVSSVTKYLKAAGYEKVIVSASVGHISSLKDNRTSYKNTGIFPEENFRMNIAISEDKKEIVKKLSDLVKAVDYVFVMTDPDREGEAIAWSLIKFLALKPGKYFRAITHEITPKAIVKAIENPISLNEYLVDAAHARMALDKLVGYSISPVARTYIGAKSVGRCQSAALKLIVDREREILEFIPETYYDLYLDFTKSGNDFKAKYVGTDETPIQHLKSSAEVKLVKHKCNSDFIIKTIDKKEKQESPKPPFTTVTYQQEIANTLGLKVKDAMSIAQKLFEAGRITYMRTDSTDMSKDFLEDLKSYININYGNIFTEPRKGKKSGTEQDGHECLRVTDITLTPEDYNKKDKNNLNQKVYKIIWQRTIAACLPNARISETNYNIYNNDQKFVFTSNELIYDGYKQIYKNEEQEEKLVKETFEVDEVLQNCELDDVKKQTTPPARFTEASLVAKLKDTGIGRPSTYAGIIDTVLSPTRGYAEIIDKKIVPTLRGTQLSEFLDRSFSNIINLSYTKTMEEQLDLIAENKLNKTNFLNTFYKELVRTIEENTEEVEQEEKICPICGANMQIRRSRFGKLFYGCTQYPNCRGIIGIN